MTLSPYRRPSVLLPLFGTGSIGQTVPKRRKRIQIDFSTRRRTLAMVQRLKYFMPIRYNRSVVVKLVDLFLLKD